MKKLLLICFVLVVCASCKNQPTAAKTEDIEWKTSVVERAEKYQSTGSNPSAIGISDFKSILLENSDCFSVELLGKSESVIMASLVKEGDTITYAKLNDEYLIKYIRPYKK